MLLACHCTSGISKDKQRSSSAKNSGKLKTTITGGAAKARPMTGSNSSKPTPAPQLCQRRVLARADGSLRAPARRHGKHNFNMANAKLRGTEPLRNSAKSQETEPLRELASYQVVCSFDVPCLAKYCVSIRTRCLPQDCLQCVFYLAATSNDGCVLTLCAIIRMFYLQPTSNGVRILSLYTLEHRRNHM